MKSPEQAAFKTILVIAVLIAIAVLPLAARSDSHRPVPPTFAEFDADDDGRISAKEFETLRAERIAANAAEGRQMRGLASAPAFADVDTDGDGFLGEDEFNTARKAHRAEMRQRRGEGHGQGKGQGHGPHAGHGGGHHGKTMPTFEDLDLDGNGCINPSEFAEHQASYHARRHAEAPETE